MKEGEGLETDRERDGDTDRKWIKEISIQTTVQGKTHCRGGVCYSCVYLTSGKKLHSCPRFFTPHWSDSFKVAIAFTLSRWKISFRASFCYIFPIKWHDVGIRSYYSIYFPGSEKPLPNLRTSNVVFFSILCLFLVSKYLGNGSFSLTYILSNWKLILWLPGNIFF